MNNDIKKIEDSLKDLVSKNEDAIKGFEKASENSKDVGIKSYFEKKIIDRMQFLKVAQPVHYTELGWMLRHSLLKIMMKQC